MSRKPNEELIQKLLDLAELELRKGNRPEMKKLAESVDASPSIINHYFNDAQGLINQAWKNIVSKYVADDYKLLRSLAEANDWDGVEKLVSEVFSSQRHLSRLAHLRGLAEGLGSPELLTEIVKVQDETISTWEKFLEEFETKGIITLRAPARVVASFIVGVPLGVSATLVEPTDSDLEEFSNTWNQIIQSLLKP